VKPLAAVLAFWLLVALVVGWALATAYSADQEAWAVVVVLAVVPVVALSSFLWFAFREFLR
jgi:hypothetical protein